MLTTIVILIGFFWILYASYRISEHRRQKRVAQDFKDEWAFQKQQMIYTLKRRQRLYDERKRKTN